MGWDEVAEMEPPDKFAPTKPEQPVKQSKQKTMKTSEKDSLDDNEVPFSPQRRVFGVQTRSRKGKSR